MTPASRLATLAAGHGWAHTLVERDDATVLLLKRDGQVLVGLWESGRWRSGFALRRGDAGLLGVRALAELVKHDGDLDAALDALGQVARDRREARATAVKERAAERREQKTAEAMGKARAG